MHFNLNQSLKQPEFDNTDCKIVEIKVPISSKPTMIVRFRVQ